MPKVGALSKGRMTTEKGDGKMSGGLRRRVTLCLITAFVFMSSIASFAGTINYTYDELNRLKTEEYGEESNKTIIEYQYDKLGNRTHRIVTLPTYTVSTAILEGAGSISPTSASVTKGSNTAFTVTPNTGYHIASERVRLGV